MWNFLKRFPFSFCSSLEFNQKKINKNYRFKRVKEFPSSLLLKINNSEFQGFVSEYKRLELGNFYSYDGTSISNFNHRKNFYAEKYKYSNEYVDINYVNSNIFQHKKLIQAEQYSYFKQIDLYNLAKNKDDFVDENGNNVSYNITRNNDVYTLENGGNLYYERYKKFLNDITTNDIIKNVIDEPIVKNGKIITKKGIKLFAPIEIITFLTGAFKIKFSDISGEIIFNNNAEILGHKYKIKNTIIKIYNDAYYIDFSTQQEAMKHICNILLYGHNNVKLMSVNGKIFYTDKFYSWRYDDITIPEAGKLHQIFIHNDLEFRKDGIIFEKTLNPHPKEVHNISEINLDEKTDGITAHNMLSILSFVYSSYLKNQAMYIEEDKMQGIRDVVLNILKQAKEKNKEKEYKKSLKYIKDTFENKKNDILKKAEKEEGEGIKQNKLSDENKNKLEKDSLKSVICPLSQKGIKYNFKNGKYVFPTNPAYDEARWVIDMLQEAISEKVQEAINNQTLPHRISKDITPPSWYIPKELMKWGINKYCYYLTFSKTIEEAKEKTKEEILKTYINGYLLFIFQIRTGYDASDNPEYCYIVGEIPDDEKYKDELSPDYNNDEAIVNGLYKRIFFTAIPDEKGCDVKIIFSKPLLVGLKEKNRIYILEDKLFCTLNNDKEIVMHNFFNSGNSQILDVSINPKKENTYFVDYKINLSDETLTDESFISKKLRLVDYNFNSQSNKKNKRVINIVNGYIKTRKSRTGAYSSVVSRSSRVNW